MISKRENICEMLRMWQDMAQHSYMQAQHYYSCGSFKIAAYFQRQGARDFREIETFQRMLRDEP